MPSTFLLLGLLPLVLAGSCPSGWSTYKGATKCYKSYTPDIMFSDFDYVAACTQLGSTIASINSDADNQFLMSIAGNNPFWFGLYMNSMNDWRNVDGTNVTFNNFKNLWSPQRGCLSQVTPLGAWKQGCDTQSETQVMCQRDFNQACPSGFVPYKPAGANATTCYMLGYTNTWQNALNDCKSRGATLATITSAAENSFVSQLASAHTPLAPTQQVWLGGIYFGGSWEWSDFTAMSFTNWGPGNGTVKNIPSACLALSADEQPGSTANSWAGKWFPSDCSKAQRAYICKSSPAQ